MRYFGLPHSAICGYLSGAAPETPGKCPIKTHVFSERSEAIKMEIAAKDRTHEEQQIKRLLAYQKQISEADREV